MNGQNALDPRNLTFSQAYGYEELPQPLKLEELGEEARTRLWNLVYTFASRECGRNSTKNYTPLGRRWSSILRSLHLDFHVFPINEFSSNFGTLFSVYQSMFMNAPFNRIFDLLLAIVRHQECPPQFPEAVSLEFRKCRLAYVLDVGPPPAIFPAATQEEGETILRTIAELSDTGLSGAVSHLRHASVCITQGDYRGAVRESIHAVESTARHFDPNAKTLEPALRALEGAKTLHPALKQAVSKLYGYSSDEQGIRHALIDNPQANVDQDEAVFMLGACAAFSSYLARKHRNSAS